jgi:hypothetical protein
MLAGGGVEYHQLMLKVWKNDELSPEQRSRLSSLMMTVFSQHWQVHCQHEARLLDDEIHDAYERRLVEMSGRESIVRWWRHNHASFGTSFQRYVDNIFGTMGEDSINAALHRMNDSLDR